MEHEFFVAKVSNTSFLLRIERHPEEVANTDEVKLTSSSSSLRSGPCFGQRSMCIGEDGRAHNLVEGGA